MTVALQEARPRAADWLPAGLDFGVRDFLRILRRRLFAGAFAGAVTAALIGTLLVAQPRRYEAVATLIVDPNPGAAIGAGLVQRREPVDEMTVDGEVRVLATHAIAKRVALALDLSSDPEFNEAIRKGTGADGEDALERTVYELQRATDIARDGRTRVIAIAVRSASPQKAQAIANAYVDQYLNTQLDMKLVSSKRASDFLGERLDTLAAEVRDAERAVEAYRSREGLLSAEGAPLNERRLAEAESQAAILAADLSRTDAAYRQALIDLDAGRTPDVVIGADASETIVELRRQEAEVVRRVAELRETFGPDWPARREAETELADLREEVDRQARRVVEAMAKDVEVARARAQALDQSIVRLRTTLMGDNSAHVRLRELERTAEAARTQLEQFLASQRQSADVARVLAPEARLVSAAAVPTKHVSPRRLAGLLIAALAGAIVACGVIFLLELFRKGYWTSSEFESDSGLKRLALLPRVTAHQADDPLPPDASTAERARYVLDHPTSSFATAIRTLRVATASAGRPAPRIIAIASPVGDMTAAWVAQSFARLSAKAGAKTLLIDADARSRAVSRTEADAPLYDLIDVLRGDRTLDAAVMRDSSDVIDVLALGVDVAAFEDLVEGRGLGSCLDDAREAYDIVVVHVGPALIAPAARAVAARCDAVILLTRWRNTSRALVREAAAALRDAGATVIGGALTDMDFSRPRLCADDGADGFFKAAARSAKGR